MSGRAVTLGLRKLPHPSHHQNPPPQYLPVTVHPAKQKMFIFVQLYLLNMPYFITKMLSSFLTLRSTELSGISAVWCSILITLRQNYGCKPLLFILFVQQGFIIFGSKRSPKSALVLSPFVRLSVCASVRARFQFREAISELLVHSSEYKECTYNLCVFTNSVCIPSLLVNFPNFLSSGSIYVCVCVRLWILGILGILHSIFTQSSLNLSAAFHQSFSLLAVTLQSLCSLFAVCLQSPCSLLAVS